MPRIAFLTNFIPPYRIKLLERLRQRLGNLKIFVSVDMESDRPWAVDGGTLDIVAQRNLTIPGLRRHPSGFTQKLLIHIPYDTVARLWGYAPDIVISSELGFRTLQAALYRLLTPNSRLIVWATLSEQTELGWGLARRLLRRFILRVADGVLCNGQSGRRYITGFGFPAERVTIINQPIDVELFAGIAPFREAENARRLMFSGRLIPLKAVVQMQAALISWAQKNPNEKLELLWVGDGELRQTLEETPLPNNFSQVFAGNQAYSALPEIYANCGVLILPSLIDEWGLVVNEAMVSGLIVIGSIYSQAVNEMVKDHDNGWLIDPLRRGSIEHALDLLFATPLKTLTKMREAARKRALMITPEVAADRICTALSSVLGQAVVPESIGNDGLLPVGCKKPATIRPIVTTRVKHGHD
jgi:glycosyltransferase involved in cell wall biosynthesis